MTDQVPSRRNPSSLLFPIATAALAIVIFVADTVTTKDLAVGSAYMAVVLMAARFCEARSLVLVAVGCIALIVLSYLLSPPIPTTDEALINLLLRGVAIGVTTFLILQSQSAQAASREKASLLDLTHDTIFVRDMNDIITYWNRGAAELYGWTREEAVGRVSHQLMRTIFPAPLNEIHAQLLDSGRWDGELIHTRRDGRQVVAASRWALQRDRQGRPIATLETNNDVTERKRAEGALRDSERRYRNIFETAGVSIWEQDFSEVKAATEALKAQGVQDFRTHLAQHPEFLQQAMSMVKVIDVNDTTVKLFGANSKEDLLGSLHAIFTPESQQAFAGELIVIAEGLTYFASETSLQTLKGDKLAVLFTITFPAQPSKLESVLVTATDITERKRAEMLTSQVFEMAPDGISIVGRDYRFRRVNPVYERNWKMPTTRIVGMHVSELAGSALFDETIKPNLDRCFAGEDVNFAQWITTARGRLFLSVTYSPLRPDSERVEAALVTTRDLTEHILASEALLQAQAELARMNRVTTLGSLAASIAHEINQPLAAIVTNGSAGLRWLNTEPSNLDEARQTLARVIKDANRAAEVIGRVRALATKSPIQADQLDINEVIREVIALTRGERDRNRVALDTRLADNLPMIQGDKVQLQQVILNLIMNAVEAMSGGEPRELLIGSRKEEPLNVLVSVCDSGPGLPPERIDRIFDAFYTTKAGGIGMGLSICRSIIEAHGGRLWASANSPRGATFHLALPADRVDAQRA